MSQAEINRFIADLNTKPALLAGLKSKATGLASVVAYAAGAGYAFTEKDAREYMRGISLKTLSDAHIDHLAGGKGNPQQGGQPSDPGFVSPPIYPEGQPPPAAPVTIGVIIVAVGVVAVR
jgi:hypothetical protein